MEWATAIDSTQETFPENLILFFGLARRSFSFTAVFGINMVVGITGSRNRRLIFGNPNWNKTNLAI